MFDLKTTIGDTITQETLTKIHPVDELYRLNTLLVSYLKELTLSGYVLT